MREPKDITIRDTILEQILKNHIHWIDRDCEGWRGLRANLSGANLSGANLNGADLWSAYLNGANLSGAYLRGANLSGANLRGANLSGADLNDTKLNGANINGADLNGANLSGSYLWRTDLSGADLNGANLSGANLMDVKGELIEYRKGKILTEDIIGYKKCKHGVIVTLLIPRGAIVFSINGNKCRTNRVKVIAIDGTDRAYSKYNCMTYYVGDEFNIYNFNCEYNIECGEGIHFFMTREEAEKF